MVYDRDFLLLDAILDKDISPITGVSPFVPGTDRSAESFGEFEIKIKMEPPPPEDEREPDTLYAGLTHDGKANDIAVVGYRIYLNDRGYRYEDGHPQAVSGGVTEPKFVIYDADGNPRCPDGRKSRTAYSKVIGSLLLSNWKNILDPSMEIGEFKSPPEWTNNASEKTQSELLFVPSPDTNYIMAPVSGEFGELLVMRWKMPEVPTETFEGEPFPEPEEYDMRYFSISFDYFDRSRYEQVFCEKTVVDVEIPALPDGTSQIVIGFGGIERPGSVPPEQWVGLEMDKGLAVVRNIVVNPEYPGYFWKLPPGPVPAEYDKYTPGGVYCSVEEFERNPDIGLERADLLVRDMASR